MSIATIITNLAAQITDGTMGVTGLLTCYTGAPERLDAAMLPALVILHEGTDYHAQAAGLGRQDHRFKLLLFLGERGADAGLSALETLARPYIAAVATSLARDIRLGLATVDWSELQAYQYGGLIYNSPDGRPNYTGIAFDLLVCEKESTTYAT